MARDSYHGHLTPTNFTPIGCDTDEPREPEDEALKSLQVVFVNSKGERVDVPRNPPPNPPVVLEQHPASEYHDTAQRSNPTSFAKRTVSHKSRNAVRGWT